MKTRTRFALWLSHCHRCQKSVQKSVEVAVARYWSNWKAPAASPYEPRKTQKVLVLLLDGHVGDNVLATVFLKTLKTLRPDIEITVATASSQESFFANCDLVDQLIVASGRKKKYRTGPTIEAIRKKNMRFCVVVDMHSRPRMWWLPFLHQINAKHYIGWGMEKYALFDLSVPEGEPHFAERRKALARIVAGETVGSCKVGPEDYFLPTDENEEDRVRECLDNFAPSRFRVLINLFAYSPLRCFQESRALKLLRMWHDRFPDHSLFLFPTPGYESKVHCIAAELGSANIAVAPSLTSYATTTALVRQVDMVFSPDTGTVHFCSALNTPIVAVYRNDPKNFSDWGPLSDRQAVVFTRALVYPTEQVRICEFDYEELMAQVESLSSTYN